MATRARTLLRIWLAVAVVVTALVLAVLFWPDPPGLLVQRPSPPAGDRVSAPPPAVRNPARRRWWTG